MRLLADESCDASVVRALRAAGHDLIAIAEVARGALDESVIEIASREHRLVLMEDKDFGQLVFAAARSATGVILLRFPSPARGSMSAAILALLEERGDALVGSFVTLQPGRARVIRLP